MKIKTISIILFLLLSFAFLYPAFDNSAKAQPDFSDKSIDIAPTPVSTPCKYPPLSPNSKQFIYKWIMFTIFKTDQYSSINVFYRIETIKPKNIDVITDPTRNEEIAATLINNFINENKSTYKLPKDLSTKLNSLTGFNTEDADIDKMAQESLNNHQDIFPVTLFSNMGIDDSHRQALVYVEFYGKDKKVVREYLHLILMKNERVKNVDEITRIIVANTISVGN